MMIFDYLILGTVLRSICLGADRKLESKEQRLKRAKEIGKQTAYKKIGIKVEKKDEHTWIVKKENK